MQNGGYINYTLPNRRLREIYGIGPYSSSITKFEWLQEYEGALSYEVKGLIPFDGDGHWNICFDYRKNKSEPVITYIDTECDREENIAANFKEYLQKLVISTEDEFVYDTGQSIQELMQQLSHAFNIEFTMFDSFNFGYPYYHGKYDAVGISIKSNKVPRAYIRTGDSCYEGYLPLKDEMTIMYPGIPTTALLITPSTLNQEKVFNDLTAKGFSVKRIQEYYQ